MYVQKVIGGVRVRSDNRHPGVSDKLSLLLLTVLDRGVFSSRVGSCAPQPSAVSLSATCDRGGPGAAQAAVLTDRQSDSSIVR
jgi:hypothetical protein